MAFQLDDYVTVAERIEVFRAKHPEGSIQTKWELVEWPTPIKNPDGTWGTMNRAFIIVTAWAYRSPDDPRPGVAHAQEPYPGTTPYTKNSELMNAETSATGRAIVHVLAADTKKGIASRDEVQVRR